jgi:hypothetical protein
MFRRTLLFAVVSSLALGTGACDSTLQLTEPGAAEQGGGLTGQASDTTGVDDRGLGGHGADDPAGDDRGGDSGGGQGRGGADDPANHT